MKIFFTFLCVSFAYLGSAQLPSKIIAIEGNVIELSSDSEFNLASYMPLVINDEIKIECSAEGYFSVRIPYKSDKLNVYLESSEYEIIQPREGEHLFETNIRPNTKYTLLIIVINKEADQALRQDIASAQTEIDRLRSKNTYTQRQLQVLNRRMIDSIQSYRKKLAIQEEAIAKLEKAYEESSQQNQSLNDSLTLFRNELTQLQADNKVLIMQLSAAMEERFLRQKSVFDDLSENLRLYVSRTKDIRDHLKTLENMVKSGQLQYYYKSLERYNEIYEALEGSKDEYENGVDHYWDSPELTDAYREIEKFLFEEIHKKEVLDLNNTVNYELQKASGGKKIKLKNLRKISEKSVETMSKKIVKLETLVEEYLSHLVVF